jgi:hypothetical protein
VHKTITSGRKPSSLVYKIERALEDGPVTLGAFLDKNGEPDNTTMIAEEYGVERGVLIWICAILSILTRQNLCSSP